MPDDATSLVQLASMFDQIDQTSKAIEFYTRAVIYNQKSPHLRIALGKLFQKQGDFAVAVRCFLAAVSLLSNNADGPAAKALQRDAQAYVGRAMFLLGQRETGMGFIVVRTRMPSALAYFARLDCGSYSAPVISGDQESIKGRRG
jgi:tetratricopeptide (TPR) repeat protein